MGLTVSFFSEFTDGDNSGGVFACFYCLCNFYRFWASTLLWSWRGRVERYALVNGSANLKSYVWWTLLCTLVASNLWYPSPMPRRAKNVLLGVKVPDTGVYTVVLLTYLSSSREICTIHNRSGFNSTLLLSCIHSFRPVWWGSHVLACTSFMMCCISYPAHLSNTSSRNSQCNTSFKTKNLVILCIVSTCLEALEQIAYSIKLPKRELPNHQLAPDPPRWCISFEFGGFLKSGSSLLSETIILRFPPFEKVRNARSPANT